ncbi:MAG: ZmpA/ZmpB/ZmpC family metallo-endopeptidase-related protein, partial [Alphaproteobacteria bacterium]
MSSNPNGNYYLANDIDCSATSSWNNGAGFYPIGYSGAFTGTFDGQYHTITGLYINRNLHAVGLFSYATGATIKNVMVNANIVNAFNRSALLIGIATNVNVSNCYTTGSIKSDMEAGGLIGVADNTYIVDSYSTASVSGYGILVGGLVAQSLNSSTATHSYWDTETSGQSSSALGEGKTTAEMKKQTTFENWDFAGSLWCIREDTDYPRFCSSIKFITITNCLELQNAANNLAGYYKLANDIDCSATANWNGGAGFDPIGVNYLQSFTGFFDGRGYSINNLKINRPGDYYIGLFSSIKGATIQNLRLNNANIKSNYGVGILTGLAYSNSSIYNCHISGTVESTASGDNGSGGMMAFLTTGSKITSSSSNVSIHGLTIRIGGMVGYVKNGSSIINSHSSGTINSENDDAGGLAGMLDSSSIVNSYSTSTVNGSDKVGSLVGTVFNNSNVTNSYAMGTVNGGSNVGGLVGYLYSGSGISDSFSVSSVNGSGSAVGGLVGYARDDAK